MNSHWSQLGLATLCALLISCSDKGKDDNAPTTQTQSSGTEAAAEPRGLEESIDQIVAEAAKLPRAEFDPEALARQLGTDPKAHFEWVRDHTWWAPYRGLLRGSQGVMLDRLGSNLDRAVLLGDLLHRAGHQIRLAHATLPDARARELFERVRPIPPQRAVPAEEHKIPAEATALVQSQTDALLAAVRDAASPAVADEDASIAALKDHWWVQREENGKWIDMDVLLSDARMGDSILAASSTSGWNAGQSAPAIPDADWHSVQLRVVVERYEAGATSEATALETVIRPAEVLGRPVKLNHIPVPWPKQIPDAQANPQPFKDAATAVKFWMPVLQVGEDLILQSGFTSEGDVQGNLSPESVAKVGGSEVVSGMDMALGGFGPDVNPPAATAEWIDYEIRVPGSPVKRLRRPIFDLLGPSRRANKSDAFNGAEELRKLERFEALWSQTDILLQSCDFTGAYVTHLNSADVVENQQDLKALARESDPAKARTMAEELIKRIEFWGALPNLVYLRSALGGPARDAFIDQPNVLHYRWGRTVVDASQPAFRKSLDIGANPSGLRQGASASSFEARVRQGVVDTVAEVLALGSDLGAAANTASVFGRLAKENSRGMFIAARDEGTAQQLPWPEDEIARVVADVSAGYAVVVPRQAVVVGGQQRVGWWRVDPESGETIGVMDNGLHSNEAKVVAFLIAMGPLLADQRFMQRMDNIRLFVSHYGPRLVTQSELTLLRMTDLARTMLGALGG